MTVSDDLPPLSRDASPGADGADSVALLPPPNLPPPSPDALERTGVKVRLLDRLLMVGVLALAFLLALLPARNSDVWLHLASGRLLAHGQYQFGVDPFAFTTSGVRWVNPSWLYDLLSFLLFQAGGGTALVIGKAVLMALLAWTLIRLGRTTADRPNDGSGWTAGGCAALALLVVGSSMPLRPICVSYLLLAITLWMLETRLADDRPRSLASWWPLPLLFALWANLDGWFLLGPLTVGLYALGSLAAGRERLGQARHLGLVFLAGLAACLLNPQHYHVFALPLQLPFLAEGKILRDDPLFGRLLFLSPFERNYLRFSDLPHLGRLLYYVLLLLGGVSFVLNVRNGVRSASLRRLPTWLLFFALSALDAAAVPFLAIVAAPLTALNFQEYIRHRRAMRSSARPPSPLWTIGGRILTVALTLALLVVAWPGWLQGQLREPRGWIVETDSSLVEAVQQATQWRSEGRLHDGETGFNFSPTTAHYFAWFAPEEKSFCDSRWQQCAPATADYVTVRRALLGDASAGDAARNILRTQHVTYLVLHDSDVQSTAAVFQRLVTAPDEWPILFLKGDTVVFGWRDPSQAGEPDRFAAWRLDFHRRAFQPPEDERAPATAGPEPNAADWRSFWTTASSAPSHDRDEAALYLIYFDTLRPSFLARHRAAWENSLATGIVAGAPALTTLPRQFLDFTALQVSREGPRPRADGGIWPLDRLAMRLTENYDFQQDEGPPGLLLLAVRAGRRAVKENPNDAQAYQLLGEAYLHLAHNTRERTWKRNLPSLTHVRHIQTAVALHRALLLQPDRIQAHTDLYLLYQNMGLLDLALQHLRHVFRLLPTHGSIRGESREFRAERLRQMNQAVEALDAEVRKRQNEYEVGAARRPVLDQAIRALEHGLAGQALDLLLASDVAVFGKRGTEIELDLLLTVGRVHDVREWMLPSQESELGSDSYHRLRILLEAAAGDYQACAEELAQLAVPLDKPITMIFQAYTFSHKATKKPTPPLEPPPTDYRLQTFPRQVACLKFAQILLAAPGQKQTILQLFESRLQTTELLEHLKEFPSEIRQRAEVDVLRGALDLERGDVPQAESFLRRALSVWRSERAAASGGGLDFGGRPAAQGMLEWLSKAEPRP